MKNGKLILSRKSSQSIALKTASGDEIVVTVEKIKGNRVSLSVSADTSVRIIRSELAREEPTCRSAE